MLVIFLAGLLVVLLTFTFREFIQLRRVKRLLHDSYSHKFSSSLLKNTHEGVWIANKDHVVEFVNKSFTRITHFSSKQVIGKKFQINFFSPNQNPQDLETWKTIQEQGFWSGEEWSQRANGDKICLSYSITQVSATDDSEDIRYIGMFSDITYRKKSDSELQRLATRDTLTGLPNRTLLLEYIENAIHSAVEPHPHFVLMSLDLVKFKKINEALGRQHGDVVLIKTAKRISNEIHHDAVIARISADEFSILLPAHLVKDNPQGLANIIASRILSALDKPIRLDNIDVNISASIGIAIYPDDGNSSDALVRAADSAVTHAKQQQNGSIQMYNNKMQETAPEHLELESELWKGIKNNEFEIYYQPKIDVRHKTIIGLEALIRWNSPTRGLVGPNSFIPIAEDNGMIVRLGRLVTDIVCGHIKEWQATGDLVGRVAINISALHFQQTDMVEDLVGIAAKHDVRPESLEIEITESAMMKDSEFALRQINKLRHHGFTIALDDFGTGYSSLSYLKTFPIDRLKIDRSFIKDISESDQDRNIASAIIRLANSLQINVIAEGVETDDQAYLLHVIGCEEMQGYLFSRPVPMPEVRGLIEKFSGKDEGLDAG